MNSRVISHSAAKLQLIWILLVTSAHYLFAYETLSEHQISQIYQWEKVDITSKLQNISSTTKFASSLINGQNLYVSIATISSRINKVSDTVISLLNGTYVPNHIFVMISSDPFLMDKGVSIKNIPRELISIAKNYPVSIIYTNNTGPHRKLLPILAKYWTEDCVIITIDDDKGKNLAKNTIEQLIKYYVISNKDSVVGLRTKRLGICEDTPYSRTAPYSNWVPLPYGRKEMLAIPTGTGGVLYRPRFFHPIIFDHELRNLTASGDDLTFRLATLANEVYVVSGCRDYVFNGKLKTCSFVARVQKAKKPTNINDKNTTNNYNNNSSIINENKQNQRRKKRKNNSKNIKPSATEVGAAKRRLGLYSMNRLENDIMWDKAVEYMKKLGILNMKQIIERYTPVERNSCMITVDFFSLFYCQTSYMTSFTFAYWPIEQQGPRGKFPRYSKGNSRNEEHFASEAISEPKCQKTHGQLHN
eukprot:gene5205-10420_t